MKQSTTTLIPRGRDIEFNTILKLVERIGDVKTLKTVVLKNLEHQGLYSSQPLEWCPQPEWLELFQELAQEIEPLVLFQIGKQLPQQARFPPNLNDIQKALAAMDFAYHLNHPNHEQIGHYQFTPLDNHTAQMVSTTPYPCELDRGIIQGVCQRFKTKEVEFVIVEHAYQLPCRSKGADTCTWLVSWITSTGHHSRFEKKTVVHAPPLMTM